MEDRNRPLSEALSGISQVDSTPKVEEEVTEVKPKKNKSFLIIVSILLFLILGIGGYYIYTQYFSNTDEVEHTDILEEDEDTDPDEVVHTVDQQKSDKYVMKNEGWALFSLPEYGFSAEIPPYTMQQNIEGENVKWSWTSRIEQDDNGIYPNYLTTVLLSFYPNTTTVFDCGEGCAQEHMIAVKIFKNSESKSLDEVKKVYFENIKDNGEKNAYIPTITESKEQKWGEDVITYTQSASTDFDEYEGHIVVHDEFVYVLLYHRSETPQESYDISEKVLDSLTFSK
jgi:hypothetical protein